MFLYLAPHMRPCASDMIHINETHSFDPKVYAEKRISILFGMVPDMKGNIDFVGLLGPTLYQVNRAYILPRVRSLAMHK